MAQGGTVRAVTDPAGESREPAVTKPVDTDGVRTVTIGTVLWAVALVVLLLFRGRLEAAGNGWWVWTCLAGTGLGLLGIEYTRRRRDAITRVRRYRAETSTSQPAGRGSTPGEEPTGGAEAQNGSATSADS